MTQVRVRIERVALVAGMVLATLNIWTGAPLVALLVGSRLTGGTGISMAAVAAIAFVMGFLCLVLIRVLAALGSRYDHITGRRATTRRHTPWLRSLSGARPHELGFDKARLTMLEIVLVCMVVLAVVSYEVWFFFFSGSPLGGPNGRG